VQVLERLTLALVVVEQQLAVVPQEQVAQVL
jgi:hypothetical protein